MGHDLFYPPNVGGWKEGRQWLASRTIVARANFADALVEGRLWNPARVPRIEEMAARRGVSNDLGQGVTWFANLLWGDAPPPIVQDVVEAAQSAQSDRPLARAVARLMARPEHQLT
jgi:hypothetical protein